MQLSESSVARDSTGPARWTIRGRRLAIAALLVASWALAILLVDPRGEFPLNDDWDFTLSTWWFADHLEFRFTPLTVVSLRAQVIWGALWTWIFGKSYLALRASVLVLSLGSLLMLEDLLRRSGVKVSWRLAAVFALLVHPVFFWASFTYMTEVPYVFASIVVSWCFVRGWMEQRTDWIVAGCLATVAAFFIRQTGIVHAAAALAVSLLAARRGRPIPRGAILAPAFTILLFAVLFVGTDLLTPSRRELSQHAAIWLHSDLRIRTVPFEYTIANFAAGALFLAPLTALFWRIRSLSRTDAVLRLGAFLFFLAVLGNALAWEAPLLPRQLLGDVLANFGLGPRTLRDVTVFGLEQPHALPVTGRWALTVPALLLGGGLFGIAVMGVWRSAATGVPSASSLASWQLAAGHVSLFASGLYLDRYSLDTLWPAIVLFAVLLSAERIRAWPAAILILALAFFSAGATAEYLDWNRARWNLFAALRAEGVPLEEIDGGYEINQYLLGGFSGQRSMGRRGFAVVDDRYVLAFAPRLPGYEPVGTRTYQGFFGLRRGTVVAHRRVDQSAVPEERGNWPEGVARPR